MDYVRGHLISLNGKRCGYLPQGIVLYVGLSKRACKYAKYAVVSMLPLAGIQTDISNAANLQWIYNQVYWVSETCDG